MLISIVSLTPNHPPILLQHPVHFMKWGSDPLPSLPLDTLVSRNIKRFALTGRYIPVFAIDITKKRCEELLETKKGNDSGDGFEVSDASDLANVTSAAHLLFKIYSLTFNLLRPLARAGR